MTGFSFPPPPPPPPKATSSSQQGPPVHSNARGGGRGGGRGNRGSFRGRGGGQQQRGGRPQQPQYHQNFDGNANQGYYNQSGIQNGVTPHQQQMPALPLPPPGLYINPAFGGLQGQTQAPVSLYDQTQAYQASASYQNNAGASNPWSGQKRTREQAFPHAAQRHPMKKPPNTVPKPQVAPAVPSFGAPIPLPPRPGTVSVASSVSRPRAPGNLGLLPQTYTSDPESSASEAEQDDEEVDEEAALGTLKSGPLTFEIDGEISTLKTEAEIAEWIEERRKRWPSRRRVEEKQAEVRSRMEERRRIEDETKAAIAVASGGVYHPVVARPRPEKSYHDEQRQRRQQQHEQLVPAAREQETGDPPRGETKQEPQEQEVAEPQTLVLVSAPKDKQGTAADDETTSPERTREPQAERPLARDGETSENSPPHQGPSHRKLPEQAAPGQGTPDPEPGPDPDSESEGAPEEASSKTHHPIRVPPAPAAAAAAVAPRQAQSEMKNRCVSFLNTGRCKFGGKCRYAHDASSSSSSGGGNNSRGKRMSLFERLIDQETETENKLAVRVIKHLGSVGFFASASK